MALKAVFSEGRTLCVRVVRPHECQDIPFSADGLTMSRWSRGHMPRSSRCLPIRACGARPSAGGAKRRREGLTRANPEMTRKAVFSEGRTLCVRFARPHECQDIAFPPGAFTIAPQSKRGMLGLARWFPLRACGARPSAGGQAQDRSPSGESPEMTRKAVFSEGRTLCVRVVRPRECRDIAFPPGAFTIAPQPKRGMLGLARWFPLRACGARPSAGGQAQDRSPSGASPEMTREGGFLGGTHFVRPRCEAPRMPRHCIPAGCVHDRPSIKTGDVGVSPMLSFAGVRSPPLRGEAKRR
jgi:hypothetical protein